MSLKVIEIKQLLKLFDVIVMIQIKQNKIIEFFISYFYCNVTLLQLL